MKSTIISIMLVGLATAGFVRADVVLPAGLTGFWEFSDSTNIAHATVGTDLGLHNVSGSDWVLGGLGGAIDVDRNAWLIVTHNIAPGAGGGS